MDTITFDAPPYTLKDYRDFCWASYPNSKKSVYITSAVAFAIFIAVVCVKIFLPLDAIIYFSLFLYVIAFIAALVFLKPFFYRMAIRNTYKSFNNSENSLIELSEDYVKCSSPSEKVNLPKNQITKLRFTPEAAYIYYHNKAILIFKRCFKSESEWENVLNFIKENYSNSSEIEKQGETL